MKSQMEPDGNLDKGDDDPDTINDAAMPFREAGAE